LSANIKAVQAGRPLRPYKFRSLGQVATLGRREGIADLRGLRLRGLFGWLAARGVHLVQVPGPSRRVGVLSDWFMSLLFPGNIVTFSGLLNAPSIVSDPATGDPPGPSLDGGQAGSEDPAGT
jgi:NADH dehydrogenase